MRRLSRRTIRGSSRLGGVGQDPVYSETEDAPGPGCIFFARKDALQASVFSREAQLLCHFADVGGGDLTTHAGHYSPTFFPDDP
jgi:hypothetical protein